MQSEMRLRGDVGGEYCLLALIPHVLHLLVAHIVMLEKPMQMHQLSGKMQKCKMTPHQRCLRTLASTLRMSV